MSEPLVSYGDGAIKLTVNLSPEAMRALEDVARFYSENLTVALHRCIATTYEHLQRSVTQSYPSGPTVKSRKTK